MERIEELFQDPEQKRKDAEFIRQLTEFMEGHEFFVNDLGLICTDFETLVTMVPGDLHEEKTNDGILYTKEWMGHTYYCNWF